MISYQFLSISEDQGIMAKWIAHQIKKRGTIQLRDSSIESLSIFFSGLVTHRLEQAETYFHSQLDEDEQLFAQTIYHEILH